MRRRDVLTALRVAGFHMDARAWMRLYVEHRVSVAVARREYDRGEQMRARGVRCDCRACTGVDPRV